MSATINETRAIEAAQLVAVEENEISDATRIARYCALEELIGLSFGVMTVGYIVLSLAGLAF
jgi:hypothetical protein